MNLIEANIIPELVFLSYLPFLYKSSLLKDFSSSVRIHESILSSSFMRHLRRSIKFWQRRKNGKLILLLNCKNSLTKTFLKYAGVWRVMSKIKSNWNFRYQEWVKHQQLHCHFDTFFHQTSFMDKTWLQFQHGDKESEKYKSDQNF